MYAIMFSIKVGEKLTETDTYLKSYQNDQIKDIWQLLEIMEVDPR